MTPLTEKQQAVLDFIREYRAATGISPTTREIQVKFGWCSQTAAQRNLNVLKAKGYITTKPRRGRTIVPL